MSQHRQELVFRSVGGLRFLARRFGLRQVLVTLALTFAKQLNGTFERVTEASDLGYDRWRS